MPAIHPRHVLIDSEGFWGKFVFVQESGDLEQYWMSNAAKDPYYRDQIREMVAILGSLLFEMLIWIS